MLITGNYEREARRNLFAQMGDMYCQFDGDLCDSFNRRHIFLTPNEEKSCAFSTPGAKN